MSIVNRIVNEVLDYIEGLEKQVDRKILLVAGGFIAVLLFLCIGLLLLKLLVRV